MFVCVYRAHARKKAYVPHRFTWVARGYNPPPKRKEPPKRGSLRKCGHGLVLGLVFVLLLQFFEHPLDVVKALPVRGVVLEEPKERDEYVEGYAPHDDRADKFPAHFASLFTLM